MCMSINRKAYSKNKYAADRDATVGSIANTTKDTTIGADTVLKLGVQTPTRSAGNFFLACPPQKKKKKIGVVNIKSGGTAGAYHSGKPTW